MRLAVDEIFAKVSRALAHGPLSISELAKEADIDWRTAERYVEILAAAGLLEEVKERNARMLYLKDPDTYFDIPIASNDKQRLRAYYAFLREEVRRQREQEPSTTLIHKILWKIDQEFELSLPIGWYRYGPLALQVYRGDEKDGNINDDVRSRMSSLVQEWGGYSRKQLLKKVYEQSNNEFYIAKEDVLASVQDAEELHKHLLDLIRFAPEETRDVVTDFARTALYAGWEEVANFFEEFWKYVAMVCYRDTLKDVLGGWVEHYFEKPITVQKQDVQQYIMETVTAKSSLEDGQKPSLDNL